MGMVLPTLHRARGDEVVFRHAPVRNHINTAPMAAGVTWGVGSQQLRWSRRRSADVGRIKAGGGAIEMSQQGCHLLWLHHHQPCIFGDIFTAWINGFDRLPGVAEVG